jgi:Protein of unknown function (DUF3891)
MIRRNDAAAFWLIEQTDHARLAADLAAHLGNDRFAAPRPAAAVLQAVALHDAGWPLHDDAPTLNSQGLPTNVFEMPLGLTLPIWSLSTQLAAQSDPYAGLLVSLHGLGLSLRVKADPAQPAAERAFALIKFQHKQVEVQESLRRQLGLSIDQPLYHGLATPGRAEEEDLLLFNFRLLEFADQLSLNLCLGEAFFSIFQNLHPRPGRRPVDLRIRRSAPDTFLVEPWPFDQDVLQMNVPARRIAAIVYRDEASLRSAAGSAAKQTLHFRLHRRGALKRR